MFLTIYNQTFLLPRGELETYMITLSGVNYIVLLYYCEGTLIMTVIATETSR